MRISDWSSDVCSSDLVLTSRVFIGMILHGEPAISRLQRLVVRRPFDAEEFIIINFGSHAAPGQLRRSPLSVQESDDPKSLLTLFSLHPLPRIRRQPHPRQPWRIRRPRHPAKRRPVPSRSEEHTSELQSLMRISYAVFCLKKKKHHL